MATKTSAVEKFHDLPTTSSLTVVKCKGTIRLCVCKFSRYFMESSYFIELYCKIQVAEPLLAMCALYHYIIFWVVLCKLFSLAALFPLKLTGYL